MNKLKRIITDNGIRYTLKKVISKLMFLLGLRASQTYFLRLDLTDRIEQVLSISNICVRYIREDDLSLFNRINIYNFINAECFLSDPKKNILLAFEKEKIIGFVCCDWQNSHEIHKLGQWHLQDKSFWIGPTFVRAEYRNRKIHKHLLLQIIADMQNYGFDTAYTAINTENVASLRSFCGLGFMIIGSLKIRNFLGKKMNIGIMALDRYKEITKFSTKL